MKVPLSRDTSPAAEAVMLEIYRHAPVWRKMEIVDDAIKTGRQLSLAGLRTRHPEDSEGRLRRRLLGLVLGESLAEEVYGPLETFP